MKFNSFVIYTYRFLNFFAHRWINIPLLFHFEGIYNRFDGNTLRKKKLKIVEFNSDWVCVTLSYYWERKRTDLVKSIDFARQHDSQACSATRTRLPINLNIAWTSTTGTIHILSVTNKPANWPHKCLVWYLYTYTHNKKRLY